MEKMDCYLAGEPASQSLSESASEASKVSQLASFLLHLGILMRQSKERYTSYFCTRNLDDLRKALLHSQKILESVSRNVSSMPTILLSVVPEDLEQMVPIVLFALGRSLVRKFQGTRQVEDITKAIAMFQAALSQLPKDAGARDSARHTVSRCMMFLTFSYLERDGNLDGFPEASSLASKFGVSLEDYTNRLRLDKSLTRVTSDLGLDGEMFGLFSWTVSDNWHRLSSEAGMDLMIHLFRQARRFFSKSNFAMDYILPELGSHLVRKSCIVPSNLEDLNEAVESFCAGLKLVLRTSPRLGDYLLCATRAVLSRSTLLGRQEDLGAAVGYARQAMEIIDPQDGRFVQCLKNLTEAMSNRFRTTGDMKDLDTAIDALSRAVDTKDLEGDSLAYMFKDLFKLLKVRFERTNRYEDLSAATAAIQRALDLVAPTDPKRVGYLLRLVHCKYAQAKYLGDPEYLLQGEAHLQEVVQSVQQGHSIGNDHDSLEMISTLTDAVHVHATVNRGPEALEMLVAVIALLQRVSLNGPSQQQEPSALITLCNCLLLRWNMTSEMRYLDEAITSAHLAIKRIEEKTAEGGESILARTNFGEHVDYWVLARKTLGELLYNRYRSTNNVANLEEAVAILLEAFGMVGGPPMVRIEAGQLAIDILSDLADWDGARKVSKEVTDLLVISNSHSLGWNDKQYFQHASSRAAEYASIILEAGGDVHVFDAIEMLEMCRGIGLSHVIDNHTDLNDLTEIAPEEAERFRTLTNEMNIVIESCGDMNLRVKQTAKKIKAEAELRSCLQKIRTLEGFDRFMQGPTQGELKAAAARGPLVVVNISRIRSDAIIITKDALRLLPLLALKYKEAKGYVREELTQFSMKDFYEKNKKFRQLQDWLWNTCVKPIFKELGEVRNSPEKIHIWWIGIGVASCLPFHAAGIYRGNMSETALSLAISSYVPSIKTLIYGQRRLQDDHRVSDVQGLTSKLEVSQPKPRLAVFVMPSTPGRADLEGVQQEAEEVQMIVQGTYTTQILLQPSAKNAMAQISVCDIVHFACHGEASTPDASKSHLLLQATTPDSTIPAIDKLTLRDVAAANLSHGKLAFLSACSTAQDARVGNWGHGRVGYHDRGRFTIWDEGLHLASGFQVAGYLHVVGNLWPTNDEVSVQVAKEFYRYLVAAGEFGAGEHVAKALNKALTVIVKKHAKLPLDWAQFVHMGV